MTSTNEFIERQSLVDIATNRLREAILSGALGPDTRVIVSELQRRWNVSQIPIREAIRRLEASGLVVATPLRGSVVAGVDLEDLQAIYDLRGVIEIPLACRSVSRMSDDDVGSLREIFNDMSHLGRAGWETSTFWRRHEDFHWALVGCGENEWTRRVLDPLWQGSERYVRLFVSTFSTIEYALKLHEPLLDACVRRDLDGIATALRDHFDGTVQIVREGYLTQQRDAR